MSNFQAARALGWTSLAVGLTEIVATRWLEEQMGVDDHRALIKGFGAREIAAGATILSQPGITPTLAAGLWARVAGDAVDLALLGAAVPNTRRPSGLAAIIGIVLAVTGLDIAVAARVQHDLNHAKVASAQAKRRVTPTEAMPKGAPVRNDAAVQESRVPQL